jgi:catechol 2,3-dioxygenase-like lactoylglutathione lyase family enzyme
MNSVASPMQSLGPDPTEPGAHFRRLDHVGFAVTDLDRSIAFYEVLLGVPLLFRKVWDVAYVGEIVGYPGCVMECAFFRLPNQVILELIEYRFPEPARVDMESFSAGNAHLCLVCDNMERDYDRLRAAGYDTFRSASPVSIPWGPYRGGRACYLRDPDGISIELLEEPPGGPNWTA